MSVHRCPDCVTMNDKTNCPTCMGSSYVHRRDSDGKITHPADANAFYEYERKDKKLRPRPLKYGKPSRF